jgi:hypothetical protein
MTQPLTGPQWVQILTGPQMTQMAEMAGEYHPHRDPSRSIVLV